MKALIHYEVRRVFTRRVLLCIGVFMGLFTLALLCAGGFGSSLKVRLLEKSYIESQTLFVSAFLTSQSLVLLSVFAALSLFQRGSEDIALLMRTSRARLFLIKMMLGAGFMLFMALQVTLITSFAFEMIGSEAVDFKETLVASGLMALHYFALMSTVSVFTKSPRVLVVPIIVVFLVDTFMPYNPPLETPFNTIVSIVIPMFGSDVEQGMVAMVSWATLALTGLFFILAYSIYLEKAHN